MKNRVVFPWEFALRSVIGCVGWIVSVFLCAAATSCGRSPDEVTLYTSVDQPIAAKIVAIFERRSGVHVRIVADTEATKSVGLAERLRAERASPVADVFWSNEPFHTANLADEGLFAPLDNAIDLSDIRPEFKDARRRWAGVGLRARTLAIGVGVEGVTSIEDLADARFKDKVAIARPLAGTTGGHVAALYQLWGEARADDFFRRLRANGALVLGGNGPVAESVGGGHVLVGLTDNDDVDNAIAAGGTLRGVLPDQGDGQIGTLAIPSTVAIVGRTTINPKAIELAAFLLSAEAERRLIDEKFCAFSVRSATGAIRAMPVDYAAVARRMATAPRRATDLLDGRAQ